MKRCRFISIVVVALIAMLVFAPATALAKTPHVAYTALGDSIGVGTGGTDAVGYTDLVYRHLARTHRGATFYDLTANGMTSGLLLSCLTDPSSPYFATFNAAVADANIVTVSIGGNDLLQPVYQFIAANPQYADPAYLASLAPEQRAQLAAQINSMLMPAVAGFSVNWPMIAAHLRTVNPSARMVVNTLYNPFMPGDGLFELIDPYIKGLNQVITTTAMMPGAKYRVADVYSAFLRYADADEPLVWGVTYPNALHPTDKGYKVIYRLVRTQLKTR